MNEANRTNIEKFDNTRTLEISIFSFDNKNPITVVIVASVNANMYNWASCFLVIDSLNDLYSSSKNSSFVSIYLQFIKR